MKYQSHLSGLMRLSLGVALLLPLAGCGGGISDDLNGVFQPSPEITSLSPNSGHVGTTITINGTNLRLNDDPIQVTFNGVVSPSVSGSTTALQAQVPTGATTGPVVVTNLSRQINGVNDHSNAFTFTVN